MKNIFTFLYLCLTLITFILYGQEGEKGFSIGDTFPTFASTDVYGKEVNTEKLNGKVLLVTIEHFDDPEPSAIERTKAYAFYTAHKDEGLEAVRIASKRGVPFFISKSFVERKEREDLKEHNENWTTIIDWDGALKKLFNMTNEPLVFVVDKLGIIRYKEKGVFIVDNSLEELIKKLLKGK